MRRDDDEVEEGELDSSATAHWNDLSADNPSVERTWSKRQRAWNAADEALDARRRRMELDPRNERELYNGTHYLNTQLDPGADRGGDCRFFDGKLDEPRWHDDGRNVEERHNSDRRYESDLRDLDFRCPHRTLTLYGWAPQPASQPANDTTTPQGSRPTITSL